jgi:hypothetical protein
MDLVADDSSEQNNDQMIDCNEELERMLRDGFDKDSEYGKVFSEFLEEMKKKYGH